MAIAPIDLQTLFTQMDKAGRTHISQKEGQPLQQAIQGMQIQKKAEEMIEQVNEAQNTGEGADKINDNSKRRNENNNKKNQKENSQKDEEGEVSVLSDPSLGKKIDISL